MKQLVIAIMLVLPMMCAAQEAVKLEAEAEKKEAKLEAMAAKGRDGAKGSSIGDTSRSTGGGNGEKGGSVRN